MAGISVQLVHIARNAAGIVRIGEATKHGEALPLHRDLSDWRAFYRRRQRVAAGLEVFGNQVPALVSFGDTIKRLTADVAAIPDDAQLGHPLADACGQRLLALLFDSIEADDDRAPFQPIEIGHPSFAAVWFFLTVQLPSLLLFNAMPQQLLRRARSGDPVALGSLAALDPSLALVEPGMAHMLHADPSLLALVHRPPRLRPIRALRWKVMAAATLRVLAQAVRYPLTHRSVRELFRAFAVDLNREVDDPDLAQLADRTFERRVATLIRQRKALLMLRHPDGETEAA